MAKKKTTPVAPVVPPTTPWDALEKALNSIGPKLSPDSFTLTDFQVKFNLKRSTAQSRIRQMLSTGIIENSGMKANTRYYRLKDVK